MCFGHAQTGDAILERGQQQQLKDVARLELTRTRRGEEGGRENRQRRSGDEETTGDEDRGVREERAMQ
ncbi:unnamed protein product [Pleuronectes platessa]|uniref:Uncharacterized protein n=1 Tax=Pleuronectes platessa TaxID=8262 RepID=A0A9N7Y825_PLEPL|nr:unnamed protein product [Pleuronectes platessa]